MKPELTLYHYWRSSCSWRVRWALAHKQIAYKSVTVNILEGQQNTPEFLKKNPSGWVPCLMVGDRGLGESMAILEWIEETFPKPGLMPTDALDRAWVRQFCETIVAGTQPLQNLSVLRYYSKEEAAQKAWAQHWIARGLAACEKLLTGKSGSFCLGNHLTLADLCLIPQVYNALRFQVSLESLPNCRRIYEACKVMEHCVSSAPEAWQTV